MRAAALTKERREAFGLREARPALEPPLASAKQKGGACRTFGALSHSVRREILRKLGEGEAPAYKLAEHFELGLPSIYKHVRILRAAGLIVQEMRGKEKWCVIDRPALRRARAWLATLVEDDGAAAGAEEAQGAAPTP
jgi:DNA-binding transcriptional ArsR family regulator